VDNARIVVGATDQRCSAEVAGIVGKERMSAARSAVPPSGKPANRLGFGDIQKNSPIEFPFLPEQELIETAGLKNVPGESVEEYPRNLIDQLKHKLIHYLVGHKFSRFDNIPDLGAKGAVPLDLPAKVLACGHMGKSQSFCCELSLSALSRAG
jgi:hypothetical protein